MTTPAATMPTRNERSSPSFSSAHPRELSRYFRELELLFKKFAVAADADKKTWSTYYLSISDSDDWEMLPEFSDPVKTWEEFRKAVERMYPGSTEEARYTRADLDAHIARWRAHGVRTLGDWAEFFRTYQAITTWLISKGRFSTYDQGQRIFKVLDPAILAQMQQRLMIKDPDHDVDDSYSLDAINAAANYILRGSNISSPQATAIAPSVPTPAPPAQGSTSTSASAAVPVPGAPVKVEPFDSLVSKVDALVKRLDQLNTGGAGAAPRPRPGNGNPLSTFTCHYCGKAGHGLSNCPDVGADLQQGYIIKDANNRIAMPNGRSPPANTSQPGETMRQRVFAWHSANPGQRVTVATSSNYYALPDPEYQEDVLSADGDSVSANVFAQALQGEVQVGQIHGLSPDQMISSYQQAISALEFQKARMRDVLVPLPPHLRKAVASEKPAAEKAVAAPKDAAMPVGPPVGVKPTKVVAKKAAPQAAPEHIASPEAGSAAAPTKSAEAPTIAEPTVLLPLHPFAGVRDATYLPPPAQESSARAKVARNPAPQAESEAVDHLFTKFLDMPAPPTTIGEMFKANPWMRRKARDTFTPRYGTKEQFAEAKNYTVVETEMAREMDYVEQEMEEDATVSVLEFTATEDSGAAPRFPNGALYQDGIYVLPGVCAMSKERDEADESEEPASAQRQDTIQTANHIVPLRSIVAIVQHTAEVECIVDPGCQIVAMSERVAQVLGLACDPAVSLNMQSANGSSNHTMGIIRNVPFIIGGLVLFFQVHVVREASYDILLGRPFDELTKSVVQNRNPDQVTITITDPNSGRVAVVPTFQRGHCVFHGQNIATEEGYKPPVYPTANFQ